MMFEQHFLSKNLLEKAFTEKRFAERICAKREILVIGLMLVAICAIIRTVYEGNEWLKRFAIPDVFILHALHWKL